MRSFRSRRARLTLVVAVLCWIAGLTGQVVHNAVEQHAVCEHGELIEIEDSQVQVATISAADSGEHEHGCAFDELNAEAVENPGIQPPVTVALAHDAPLLSSHTAPRGPPLSFAPKTGPPAV